MPEEVSTQPPSLEDLFNATGGVRLGMRARADQIGKWKRTENIESFSNINEKIEMNETEQSLNIESNSLEKKKKKKIKKIIDSI